MLNNDDRGGISLEEFEMHLVSHYVFKMEYEKPRNGVFGESWFWEVYSTNVNGIWWVRLEHSGAGRKGIIPWREVGPEELKSYISEKCKAEMQKVIG